MALLFNATGENVAITQATSINSLEAITIMIWQKTALTTGFRTLYNKHTASELGTSMFTSAASAYIWCSRDRATTQAVARSANSVLVANTWQWICFMEDVNSAPNLYVGTLSALATEVSYTTQTQGVGAITADAEDLWLGNNRLFTTQHWDGDIAVVQIFNRRMTPTEALTYQYHPRMGSGCVLFHHLGLVGTGTQPDWSGNGNTGAVTSATVSNHVPLGALFGFDAALPYVVVVVAGGAVNIVPFMMARARMARN